MGTTNSEFFALRRDIIQPDKLEFDELFPVSWSQSSLPRANQVSSSFDEFDS
jgi:hypothetical protein